jgi:hypothetical protein
MGIYSLNSSYIKQSSSIVTNGLVLYLDAGDSSSYPGFGTTWYDLSGKNNNGTIFGGVSYNNSEKFFACDGINGYIDFGSSSSLSDSSNFTYSAWFKNVTPGLATTVLGRGADGLGAGWSLRIGTHTDSKYRVASVTTSPSTTANNVYSTNTYIENSWVNITAVWINGVSLSLYVNGILDVSTNFSGLTLRSSTAGWGSGRSSTTLYTRSNLAVAQVYDRVLSSSEILQNFNANRGRYKI